MKKLVNYCSIIFLLLVATSQVKAQSVDVVIRENGTERKESIDLPKSMTYPLDSLLNDWKAKNYIDLGKDCSTADGFNADSIIGRYLSSSGSPYASSASSKIGI